MEEQIYQLALTKLSLVGTKGAKELLRYFGSAQNVFAANKADYLQVDNIGKVIAESIVDSKQEALAIAEEELNYIKRNNDIEVIAYGTKGYPNRLNYCDDAPLVLFKKGQYEVNTPRMIAIVGTRKITNYGKKLIKDFIYSIKDSNITVVSGLAYGVDGEVHRTCVEYNVPNIGVLAHGLDLVYPAAHKNLASKMQSNGGLLTEYFTGTNPDRQNFPTRNRIVAGLCDATIVIESAAKGGSLITADIAASYNRDVFAFPGNIGNEFSQGCNKLIKEQKALLIESAEDLFQQLGWENTTQKPQNRQRKLFLELSETDQQIIQILLDEPLTADLISVKSLLPLSLVHTHLLNLELNGVVRLLPGNKYIVN